ncbi:MAG: alpha/beta hydrolase fold domain-containing protein [Bacteroidales bacterium]|nr:alpha/beta hydrolase fold domain-containing protein [Bacteroidales bacterium]
MDTRLSVLLQEALGLKNGDAKVIKNAGAVIPTPWDSAMRSLIVAVYELGVTEIMVVAHTTCGACHMSFHHFKEEMLKRGIPASELGINKDRVFLTGDSAGGHLALFLAEKRVTPKAVLLNCPAYDFASFANAEAYTEEALAWFIGPKWDDEQWRASVSPRTYIGSYTGPLLVSTCTNDFIRSESLKLKADCDSLGRTIEFVDIQSKDKKVGHVHNVSNPALPESRTVNALMTEFMNKHL